MARSPKAMTSRWASLSRYHSIQAWAPRQSLSLIARCKALKPIASLSSGSQERLEARTHNMQI